MAKVASCQEMDIVHQEPACSREITRWKGPSVYKAIQSSAVIVAIITNPSTSTTVTFVPGKRGALNAVVDGYRYTKNRTYKENVYNDIVGNLP